MPGPSVTIEMSADEFKLLRSLQKVIDKNREIDKSLKDAEKTGDQAGKKIGKSADDASLSMDKALKSAQDWAVGLGKVGVALGAIKLVAEAVRKEMDDAAKASEAAFKDRLKLATVAASPEAFTQSINRANEAAARYGVDPSEAARILFSAKSAGFESDFETVARAAAIGEGEGAELMATKIRSQYPTVSPTQAVDAMFAAAVLTDASPSAIGKEAPGMIPKLRPYTGASLAESLAALGLASKDAGSTAEGATTIEAFGAALLDNPEFHQLGLIETVKRLRGMSPDELSDVLGGSIEARTGFNTLSGKFNELVSNTALIDESLRLSGTDQSALAVAEAAALGDPRTGDIIRRNMSQNRLAALQEQEAGGAKINADAELARVRAMQIESGRPLLNRITGNLFSETAGMINPLLAPRAQEMGDIGMMNASDPIRAFRDPLQVPGLAYGYLSSAGRSGYFGSEVKKGQEMIDGMVDRMMTRFQMKGPSTLARPDVDR